MSEREWRGEGDILGRKSSICLMLTANSAAENAVLIMQDILVSSSGEYCHALQEKPCFTLGKEKKTKTNKNG